MQSERLEYSRSHVNRSTHYLDGPTPVDGSRLFIGAWHMNNLQTTRQPAIVHDVVTNVAVVFKPYDNGVHPPVD